MKKTIKTLTSGMILSSSLILLTPTVQAKENFTNPVDAVDVNYASTSTEFSKTYNYKSSNINTRVTVKYPNLTPKVKSYKVAKVAKNTLSSHVKRELNANLTGDSEFWNVALESPLDDNGNPMSQLYNETYYKVKIANISTSYKNIVSYKISYFIDSNVLEGAKLHKVSIVNINYKTGKAVDLATVMKNNSNTKTAFDKLYMSLSSDYYGYELSDDEKEYIKKESKETSLKDYFKMFNTIWYMNKDKEVFFVLPKFDNEIEETNLYKYKFNSKYARKSIKL